ncbi:GAF and ANTAR domain-containing protein [Kribbella turkmenica]|nr:GAF and ANTAR domain-containing protein [Kribbella turkmenica]
MSLQLDPMEFARIAQALRAAPTPTQTAEEIVDYVRRQFNASHAGLTLIRARRRLETIAPTDPLVEEADRLQYELDEGPCRDSSWRRETLISTDLATDRRWPRWAIKVCALGVASVLAAELTDVDDRRIGSINIYWTRPRQFTADDVAFVNIFARHAALALSRSLNEAELHVALDSRKLIGQAQGILMERYGLDESRAFEVLRRYSQDHNLKLRTVAEHLIATRQLPTTSGITNSAQGHGPSRSAVRSATQP